MTPHTQRTRAMTCMWFRLFPVRSPLLRESRLLSFPLGTEMVHFPRFASSPYVFRWRYPEFVGIGFPIRKSPDQSLFSDSPELIAASHVLHRLPAPRHPPYALSNLTIKFGQDKKCRFLNFQRSFFNLYLSPKLGENFLNFSSQNMVELTGIEPATSGVQNRRSPDWATAPKIFLKEKFLTRITEKISSLRTLRFPLFAQPKFLNS